MAIYVRLSIMRTNHRPQGMRTYYICMFLLNAVLCLQRKWWRKRVAVAMCRYHLFMSVETDYSVYGKEPSVRWTLRAVPSCGIVQLRRIKMEFIRMVRRSSRVLKMGSNGRSSSLLFVVVVVWPYLKYGMVRTKTNGDWYRTIWGTCKRCRIVLYGNVSLLQSTTMLK